MSNKSMDSSQDISSDTNVQEILFESQTLESKSDGKKPSNKKSKKQEKLATSSPQDSGNDSLGESSKVIAGPSLPPPALVRTNSEGKIYFDTKAIAQENSEKQKRIKELAEERKLLLDEVVTLRSQLDEALRESEASPRSHPEPGPSRDLLTDGHGKVLCKSQFTSLCKAVAKEMHSAVKPGKEVRSIPSLPLEAYGPYRMASPHDVLSGQNSERSSCRDIVGSSMGDVSGDDLEDISTDDNIG